MDDIIIIKQLPIIEERLREIGERNRKKVSDALAMICTEETVKAVKALRAELSKDFQELEKRRKDVKGRILAPYEQFESTYKSYVTDIFKPADVQLKGKIDEVENGLKEQKRIEVSGYFDEYIASKGIDFLTFKDSGIAVTLTASKKSLKDQARAFIDRVYEELAMINTQENSAEVLVEYKRTLNVAQSITTVVNRHKAMEEEIRRQEAMRQGQEARNAAAQKVEAAISEQKPVVTDAAALLGAPVAEPIKEDAPNQDELFELEFRVVATLDKLRALKAFMDEGGYQYEQL